MPRRQLRRRRGRADVEAFIREQGGREQARVTCEFFGYELADADPSLLRGLLAEFDSEMPIWADLRNRVQQMEGETCHAESVE